MVSCLRGPQGNRPYVRIPEHISLALIPGTTGKGAGAVSLGRE